MEALVGFAFEDDGVCKQPVPGGVPGGTLLSLGGDRSVGTRTVGAGGLDFSCGSHSVGTTGQAADRRAGLGTYVADLEGENWVPGMGLLQAVNY